MSNEINRRDFLKQSALAISALLSASALDLPATASRLEIKPTATPRRVLVIGAGLAGLSAAYELINAGHDVSILEARTRPGGRVHTLRAPFSDGLRAEAGAMYVYSIHDWTMKYINLFSLPLDLIVPSDLASITYLRGNRIKVKPGQSVDWPLKLTPDEKRLGRNGMTEKYIKSALKGVGEVEVLSGLPQWLKKYDYMTFAQFLRTQGASTDAVALLRLGFADLLGEGIDTVSALDLLREYAHRENVTRAYTIRGGSDILPKAFAARLADRIHYDTPVVKIEHDARGVRVVGLQKGVHQTFTADHLICALPFSTLRRIEITPRLSEEKRRAIEQLQYTSVTRTYLQTKRKFWIDEGLSGVAATDLPVMGVYHSTHNQTGTRGILESYTVGTQARHLMKMKESARIETTLEGMKNVHPAIRENYERGASVCWDADEWARGAYTWFKPGQMDRLLPHVARAEGRLHFAGEHASSWPGWMQGALEAGNRVAREINETQ